MGTHSRTPYSTRVRSALTPAGKAYALGLLSSISPRIYHLIRTRARRVRRSKARSAHNTSSDESSAPHPSGSGSRHRELKPISTELLIVLRKSVELHRFPAFCAVSIGGWSVFAPVLEVVMESVGGLGLGEGERRVLASFLAAGGSGAGGLALLNSGPGRDHHHHGHSSSSTGGGVRRITEEKGEVKKEEEKPMVGRTVDLTLFAVTRAADVVVTWMWGKWKSRRVRNGGWSLWERMLEKGMVPAVFAVSSGVVMYAWFYAPHKLPKTYNKWITDISETDPRLIEALRLIRSGTFVYGEPLAPPNTHILTSYATDLNMPPNSGDPSHTVPIPCQMVHEGHQIPCEANALRRGFKGFKFAFRMYLALNLLSKLRNPSRRAVYLALRDSIQASTFLAAFIGLFWYGVCLTRTRIGPLLLPHKPPGFFDNEYIVRVGCMLCGWSIWIEEAKRRAEMAFFVAPRALAVGLPRRYGREYLWREVLAFGLAAGVIVTAAKEERRLLRGVFGKLLSGITGRRGRVKARGLVWPFGGR